MPAVREYALFLRLLADHVLSARLSSGSRVLDAGDFRGWLTELSDLAEAAGTMEEFFDHASRESAGSKNGHVGQWHEKYR